MDDDTQVYRDIRLRCSIRQKKEKTVGEVARMWPTLSERAVVMESEQVGLTVPLCHHRISWSNIILLTSRYDHVFAPSYPMLPLPCDAIIYERRVSLPRNSFLTWR